VRKVADICEEFEMRVISSLSWQRDKIRERQSKIAPVIFERKKRDDI